MSRSHSVPSYIGNNVWISSFSHCIQLCDKYDGVIHVWRESQRDEDAMCRVVAENIDHGLKLEYSEGQSIATLIPKVEAYAKKDLVYGTLLVHCAYGGIRAPTVGLIAALARETTPEYKHLVVTRIMNDTFRALWQDRRILPQYDMKPMIEIMEYFGYN
jgi:hypothetical protein